MTIRRIAAGEEQLVAGLFDQYRVFYKKDSDVDAAEKFIRQRLSNNESVIFVAFSNVDGKDIPAGFTQLYPIYSSVRMTKNWLLNDLFVAPGFRKQKIGEMLIRTGMNFAKDQGAKFVELSTAVDNYTAQSLYEKSGFEKQSPDTDFITYRVNLVS